MSAIGNMNYTMIEKGLILFLAKTIHGFVFEEFFIGRKEIGVNERTVVKCAAFAVFRAVNDIHSGVERSIGRETKSTRRLLG